MSPRPNLISPIQALVHCSPGFFETLTEAERLVLPFLYLLWLRPEQQVLSADWRYLTLIGGRGWGKSFAIATEINRRVEAGEARSIGLMAPTEDRVEEVQIKFLIATAPPWFKPERYLGGLRWPNGVVAEVYTPIEPGRSRSGNFDCVWLTELVDWQASTRWEAFKNITTACRIGRAQVFCDTTSKGKNEVIRHLLDLHKADPETYPLVRGSTFDNPMLSKKYIRAECLKYSGQDFGEEIMGLVYAEAAGASFQQKWLDDNRRAPAEVPRLVRKIVVVDPSLVTGGDADEKGIVSGGDDGHGHIYVLADLSAQLQPEEWGDVVVKLCAEQDHAGCILETNHMGEQAIYTVRSRAALYKSPAYPNGLQVRKLPNDGKPFPRRVPGVIFVREKFARTDKQARAGGAASETEAGHVHMVGIFSTLEGQLTTYVNGVGRSPNQYDAYNYLVSELADLGEEKPRAPQAEAAQAAQITHRLQEAMRVIGRGRTI